MFTSLFPILVTADLNAALGFYRDLLGATVSFEFPGPDGEPAYAASTRHLHLGIGRDPSLAAGPEPALQPVGLRRGLRRRDRPAARGRRQGGRRARRPAVGERRRVARVLDPDGNVVNVGQRA